MKRKMTVLVLLLPMAACTWVTLDKAAQPVMVKSATEVSTCKKVAHTSVSLRSKVMGINRNEEKVRKELEILARNAAVDYEGNAVVATTAVNEGKQSFDVYQCP